ncbi:hypothetical protein GGU10DRAFT_377077 [Lentinula aff. detonsa]|uniref:RRM domain-containing protein n=1 Tax=Lentinula aff. detonsa TaxID=2804958 RepID=A0AA38KYS1_9AGAR|nr:hypothetical protein GGU10DRAFT_377077 [Lentinula aff. detonsa]
MTSSHSEFKQTEQVVGRPRTTSHDMVDHYANDAPNKHAGGRLGALGDAEDGGIPLFEDRCDREADGMVDRAGVAINGGTEMGRPVPPQESGPQPHPYLHEPLLYITNLSANITDETLGMAFMTCAPFRPRITRDSASPMVSGTIEFKFLEKAEKALATLQSRPLPGVPGVLLMLSPYPPTNPPTPLPPPSALPRLVKHLPIGFGDSALYGLFRPYGALASVRIPTHFGPDTGMIEFWNEDDAR